MPHLNTKSWASLVAVAAVTALSAPASPAAADLLTEESASAALRVIADVSSNGTALDDSDGYAITAASADFPPLLADTGSLGVAAGSATVFTSTRVQVLRFENRVGFEADASYLTSVGGQPGQVERAAGGVDLAVDYGFTLARDAEYALDFDFEGGNTSVGPVEATFVLTDAAGTTLALADLGGGGVTQAGTLAAGDYGISIRIDGAGETSFPSVTNDVAVRARVVQRHP